MSSAIWALVAACVLWGTTGTAASFFSDDVSPLAIGASTMVVGGALLFATNHRRSLAVIGDRTVRAWLLAAAAGMVAYPLAFYAAMDLAGVAIGNVVSLGSGPIFAALLEWRLHRQRLTGRWMLSASIAIAGVALLVVGGHGSGSPVDPATIPAGVALGLVAGAGYALFTLASGTIIRRGHTGRATMGAAFGLAAIPLAVVLLVVGAPLLGSLQNVGLAAYLAVGPMFLAYVFFGWGIRALRSSTVTVITLLEPLVATLLAIAVVGERLEPLGWVGLALILLGVAVLSSARQPRPAP
ncbi:DMT family transporter [Microcella sp.]|uniref:DMT family transporter n=1 Tax=Microcella sp. TaxID=1913979 RepID=UPI0025672849|nr:EamA family transporter [Microcella sp.]MBX9470958.1 EamA family transporter [Microcella sp.]